MSSSKQVDLKLYIQITSYELIRLFLGIYVYLYVYNKHGKEAMDQKETREEYMEGFEGRKGRCNYIINVII